MHRGFQQGFVPIQMTYAGPQFRYRDGRDRRAARRSTRHACAYRGCRVAWNIMGMVLLANVLTIAVLSMPMLGASVRIG